jgi:hypothetical protein
VPWSAGARVSESGAKLLSGCSNFGKTEEFSAIDATQVYVTSQNVWAECRDAHIRFQPRYRELAKRLTDAHQEHHGHQVATMHVHLDHDCLEVTRCCAAAQPRSSSSQKR